MTICDSMSPPDLGASNLIDRTSRTNRRPESLWSKEQIQRIGEIMWESISPFVCALVYRRCVRSILQPEIDDITQEVFTRLLETLQEGKLPELMVATPLDESQMIRLRQWVSITVRNIVFEFHRRSGRRPVTNYDALDSSAANRSDAAVSLLEIHSAIEDCSAGERVVLQCKACGWTTAEIAEAEGISEGTVRTRVRRARKHLHELLGPMD